MSPWKNPSRNYEGVRLHRLSLSAMLRTCFIFERILNGVYSRPGVTARLVESSSQQYRGWSLKISRQFRTRRAQRPWSRFCYAADRQHCAFEEWLILIHYLAPSEAFPRPPALISSKARKATTDCSIVSQDFHCDKCRLCCGRLGGS